MCNLDQNCLVPLQEINLDAKINIRVQGATSLMQFAPLYLADL